jgi:hypothetical protein
MTKGGARWQELPNCDVARVCSYITDDGFVASYFGISREAVQAIRAKMKKPEPPKPESTDPYAKNGSPLGATDRTRDCALFGSTQLEDACKRLYRRFEIEHSLPPGTGQRFQLQGYRA